MSNDVLYLVNANTSVVPTNGVIPLTTISRRKGQSINIGSNSATITRAGYYRVYGAVTFTGNVAGLATATLENNGVPILGATATSTITLPNDENKTLNVEAIIRVCPCSSIPNITLVNEGIGLTTSNATMIIEAI